MNEVIDIGYLGMDNAIDNLISLAQDGIDQQTELGIELAKARALTTIALILQKWDNEGIPTLVLK